jgi:hypothetical protein
MPAACQFRPSSQRIDIVIAYGIVSFWNFASLLKYATGGIR